MLNLSSFGLSTRIERYWDKAVVEIKANPSISKELIENLFILLLFKELIKPIDSNSETVVILICHVKIINILLTFTKNIPDLVSNQNFHTIKTAIIMKAMFIITALFFVVFKGYSQNPPNSSTWLEDTNGKMLMSSNHIDVDGNPYFPKEWIEGSITLKTGKNIAYNALRYNMITGNLEFNYTGKSYDVTNSMSEFTLGTMKFRNGFPSTEKQNVETYHQILYDGKQKLLCHRAANIYIDQPYNSATKTKKLDIIETYYLQKVDGKLYEVKRNLKYFLVILGDKSNQLEEYCKKENIRLRSWNDAVKVLEYAEGLEKQ